MNTLLLDQETWDLTVDLAGNIAVATNPYALAQDAASAIKLFQGELWFDVSQGVPYWATILGHSPSIPLMKSKWVAAALTVPEVVSAKCFIATIVGRQVTGQVQVSDVLGQKAVAGF